MPSQAELTRGRIIRLGTAAIAGAPTDGTGGTAPHFTMSPETATALETTGLFLGLKAPTSGAATAGGSGFSVIPWILNPVTFGWFAGAAVSVSYNQAFVTYDIDACALYFQIDPASVSVAGNVDFHLAEQ